MALDPNLAEATMREAGLDPQAPYIGVAVPWECICTRCGRTVTPTLQNVKKGHSGCRWCGAAARAAMNTRTDSEMETTLGAHGLVPLEPYQGTMQFRLCRHALCGEEVTARWSALQQGTWNCQGCKSKSVQTSTLIRLGQYGWSVHSFPAIGTKHVDATHSCGYRHLIRVADVGRFGEGCPKCSMSGFRVAIPGSFYVLRYPEFGAVKVGITNYLQQRLSQHSAKAKIEIIGTVDGPGHLVRKAELSIISEWRSAGVASVQTMAHLAGHTETADESLVDPTEILAKARRIIDPPPTLPVDLSSLTVRSIDLLDPTDRHEVMSLMVYHYTGSLPKGLRLVGAFDVAGRLRGVAGFGMPSYPGVGRAVWPGKPEAVIELRRLILEDDLGPNSESWFLSRAIKLLPSVHEVVVAFSDPSAGHTGVVYKAANFRSMGQTKPSYHYTDSNGAYIHKRGVWDKAKAAGVSERDFAASHGLERVDDLPKYRFAFPRTRAARSALDSSSGD